MIAGLKVKVSEQNVTCRPNGILKVLKCRNEIYQRIDPKD